MATRARVSPCAPDTLRVPHRLQERCGSHALEAGGVADDDRQKRRDGFRSDEVSGQSRVSLQEREWPPFIRTDQDQFRKGSAGPQCIGYVQKAVVTDPEDFDPL